ncbi:metallophosphoesterase [Sphingobium sp. BYY-5]|uniref:metallophosphoesterase n=1 Tax=Sphingobium sp. BYY-5 TaxID=2926400 RepID=UPI001FA73112|nr:metallophosphoesterase [Sphingobium sp. BYY-5]MCI4589687.1 metallophosphoesterase [Sphingobium sp. BYY-5]
MSFWRIRKRPDIQAAGRSSPDLGEDIRVYAVGDIHGRLDLLEQLLRLIADDRAVREPMPARILFLGDLVDRGPSSRQVVDRVMALVGQGDALCLKGNHEELFVHAACGDMRVLPVFRRVGGAQTLESYGLAPRLFHAMRDEEASEWMLAHIPRSHVDFLDMLPDSLEMGDYLFVHAGIRPGVAIVDQAPADLRWIRREFLAYDRPHPKMIVHGHNIAVEIDERPNRIGIDTGAYISGRLTAIGLERTDRWFLQTSI